MALKSMTGFARASGAQDGLEWNWEVRSVNGKGLDIRLRLPPGLEALDAPVRKALRQRFTRGSFQVSLQQARATAAAALRVNEELLSWLVQEARALHARIGSHAAAVDPVALLSMRGVIEAREEGADVAEVHGAALLASLEEALEGLAAARAEEGARLQAVIAAQLDEIARLAAVARADPARSPQAIARRLREQVARLLESLGGTEELDGQRLHQEAALLAARADIAEELDRLDAHVAAARELLQAEGAVGRRLEFLAQEFNREANTLCSKAPDASISRTGLELKAVIDRFREQVANIE